MIFKLQALFIEPCALVLKSRIVIIIFRPSLPKEKTNGSASVIFCIVVYLSSKLFASFWNSDWTLEWKRRKVKLHWSDTAIKGLFVISTNGQSQGEHVCDSSWDAWLGDQTQQF